MIKSVALLEWNWVGHHPLFFTAIAVAIAEAGVDVIPLCPDPIDFSIRISELHLSSDVLSRILPAEQLTWPGPSNFRPARWRSLYDEISFFTRLGQRLRKWEIFNLRPIHLVFFACIYDQQFKHFHIADRAFRFKWSGLYLHAHFCRMPGKPIFHTRQLPCPEKIFTSPGLRSLAVLDEGAVEPLRTITGGKPIVALPDFTDEAISADHSAAGLANKIISYAAGRPIISLIGHLQWLKGLSVCTKAACDPSLQDCLFFFGGNLSWDGTEARAKAELQQSWENAPNILTYFQPISSDYALNSILRASDLILAPYLDFPSSSNILTKAAVFERPIVVSDGYLMAERVKHFGLGEVIPEGDAQSLVNAIHRILSPDYSNHLRKRARWDDYRRLHSINRLKQVICELLTSS